MRRAWSVTLSNMFRAAFPVLGSAALDRNTIHLVDAIPTTSRKRFAARVMGLASGLALAVRPAGSAEAPTARVGPEDAFCEAVFAERLARIFGCPCGWRGRRGQCAAFRPGTCDAFARRLAHLARMTCPAGSTGASMHGALRRGGRCG